MLQATLILLSTSVCSLQILVLPCPREPDTAGLMKKLCISYLICGTQLNQQCRGLHLTAQTIAYRTDAAVQL